jgi:hypothetical protein
MDKELRVLFAEASEFVQPAAGLAERVRTAARRRQRGRLAVAAAVAVLVVVSLVSYVFAGMRHAAPQVALHGRGLRPGPIYLEALPATYRVQQLAVSGRYLYVLTNAPDTLSAYDRTSGRLIHQTSIPASPSALAVGPGGRVWLASAAAGGNAAGVWLLSPDLRLRSVDTGVQTSIILPAGPATALVPNQYGLVTLRMPEPGRPGRPETALLRGTAIGPSQLIAPGFWAGYVGQRVAVQGTDGHGFSSHLVIAGQPSLTFGGSLDQQIGSVASTGSTLWATTYALSSGSASPVGPLIRLDGRLRATTPASVRSSPWLSKAESVWSRGDTVWVATGARAHALVCFTAARGQIGPVTALPVSGQVVALALSRDSVYLSTARSQTNGALAVLRYPVPQSCR